MNKSFGYTFSRNERAVTGEQDVLRYSALDTWLKSKDSYRKRYYEGATFGSAEMTFGHEIHKLMEDPEQVKAHPILSQVPRYERSEYNIVVPLDDFKIGGCLDSIDLETFAFLDYKSSHRNKEGKVPWDNVRVAKHMQLPFYSVLVRSLHGKVDPNVLLVWLETAFKNKTKEFDGHTLTASSRELELTGEFKVFKRRVFKWELDSLEKVIIKSAGEINDDFTKYKHEQKNA